MVAPHVTVRGRSNAAFASARPSCGLDGLFDLAVPLILPDQRIPDSARIVEIASIYSRPFAAFLLGSPLLLSVWSARKLDREGGFILHQFRGHIPVIHCD